MRAHYFQHVEFEGLGSIQPWLINSGYEITSSQFYKSYELPDVSDVDFLIVLGGPMSVNDEEIFPWLSEEKQYIKHFIATGKPVLGICLGAQLIANSLGALVYRNKETEIGWFPIKWTDEMFEPVFKFSSLIDVFHWHGETFDIPEGAVRIAHNECCENQGFKFGESVVGLQFHLESTKTTVEQIVTHCGGELTQSFFIQSRDGIINAPDHIYDQANCVMAGILKQITGRQ